MVEDESRSAEEVDINMVGRKRERADALPKEKKSKKRKRTLKDERSKRETRNRK